MGYTSLERGLALIDTHGLTRMNVTDTQGEPVDSRQCELKAELQEELEACLRANTGTLNVEVWGETPPRAVGQRRADVKPERFKWKMIGLYGRTSPVITPDGRLNVDAGAAPVAGLPSDIAVQIARNSWDLERLKEENEELREALENGDGDDGDEPEEKAPKPAPEHWMNKGLLGMNSDQTFQVIQMLAPTINTVAPQVTQAITGLFNFKPQAANAPPPPPARPAAQPVAQAQGIAGLGPDVLAALENMMATSPEMFETVKAQLLSNFSPNGNAQAGG